MRSRLLDRFEVKGHVALEYGAAGVVLLFEHGGAQPPQSGATVLLVRPDGWWYFGKAEDVRPDETGHRCGIFLRGLKSDDVPMDAELRWGDSLPVNHEAVA